jgi:hypothetical protein
VRLHKSAEDLKEIGIGGGLRKDTETSVKTIGDPVTVRGPTSAMYRSAVTGVTDSDVLFILVLWIMTPCGLVDV